MKQAQIYGQIFIYILTLVLVSFILVYGYNAVQNFKKRAEQVSCLTFRNDLQNAVETMSSEFGSVKRKELQLCNGYHSVCFVESKGTSVNLNDIDDPIIKDSISSNSGKNVFLVDKIAKESFNAGKISVKVPPNNKDILCIDAKNNQISLRLEGQGNYVLLSEWS